MPRLQSGVPGVTLGSKRAAGVCRFTPEIPLFDGFAEKVSFLQWCCA